MTAAFQSIPERTPLRQGVASRHTIVAEGTATPNLRMSSVKRIPHTVYTLTIEPPVKVAGSVILIIILLVLTSPVFAATDFWPGYMVNPDSLEAAMEHDTAVSSDDTTVETENLGTSSGAAADENAVGPSLSLTSTTSMYQIFKTRDRLDWEQNFNRGILAQTADYRYEQISARSSIQSADLSGMILYNNVFTEGLAAGVDWSPVVSYTSTPGILQSNVDVGPVMRHSLLSVPYQVRLGVYGYGWSDTLEAFRNLSTGGLHGNPGIYGSVAIGNPLEPIGSVPLYLNINADGRALNGSNLGLMTASALYCAPLAHLGDSLFLHVGDSLTNGRELYLGEYEGKSFYSNTSWRLNHSFSGTAGVKLIQRFGITPRLYYRYFINTIAYPDKTISLDDQLRKGYQFGIAGNTDDERRLSYQGGLEIKKEFEDWLFRRDFTSFVPVTRTDSSALLINQSDHHSNAIRTTNNVKLVLPHDLSMVYQLTALKNSKEYNKTPQGKFNRDEMDRVQIYNKLALRYERDSLSYIDVYGQTGKLYHYYFSEEQSAGSKITREYRIGFDIGVSAGPFTLRENCYGDVEVADMRYAVNLPPYARDVTSTLVGNLKVIEDRLHITGKWVEMYHDDGYWYAEEYWPDSVELDNEFYAIQQKNTQYWLDFACELFWGKGKLIAGTLLHDVFLRQWRWNYDDNGERSGSYLVSELDTGYDIEPYCSIEWLTSWSLVSAKLRRIINTGDRDRFRIDKNWDFLLSIQMVF
jgi:hypothetical protein